MADYRYIHKRASHGERIQALTHLEFRVWAQYVLSADDFGVMRATATVIRADNPRLEKEPLSKIQSALKALESCALLVRFVHQSDPFLWQLDWQDYQMIRYPRHTPLPAPTLEELSNASVKTRKLFLEHHRCHFGNETKTEQEPTGAGGRETLTPTQTQTQAQTRTQENQKGESTALAPAWRMPSNHLRCPIGTAAACGRGICVPRFVADDWFTQVGGDSPEGYIANVVEIHLAATPEGTKVGDPAAFWRAAWKFRHPTPKDSKASRTLEAGQRTAAKLRAGTINADPFRVQS